MRVARVEPEGDAPAGLVEHRMLAPDRPLAGQRPVVEAQASGDDVGAAFGERGAVRGGEALATSVAEVRLRRAQVVPVGLRLHAGPFDGDELAVDAGKPLDDALRGLVTSLAEVVVAD